MSIALRLIIVFVAVFVLSGPSCEDKSSETDSIDPGYRTYEVVYNNSLYSVAFDNTKNVFLWASKRSRDPVTQQWDWEKPVPAGEVPKALELRAIAADARARAAAAGGALKWERSAALDLNPQLYVLDALGGDDQAVGGEDRIVVFEPEQGGYSGAVNIPPESRGLVLSRRSSLLYVLHHATEALPGVPARPPQITVIDAAGLAVTGSFPLPERFDIADSQRPFDITPDEQYFYIANRGDFVGGGYENSSVEVVEVQTGRLVDSILTPPRDLGPGKVAVEKVTLSPDGVMAWASSSDIVVVIDTETRTVSTSFRVTGGVRGLIFHPDGSRAYVTGFNTVRVIDTRTLQVLETIPLAGAQATDDLALTPDGLHLFVSDSRAGLRWEIYTRANAVDQVFERTPGDIELMAFPR